MGRRGEAPVIGPRREQLTLSCEPRPDARNVLQGRIRQPSFQGGSVEYDVNLGGSLSLRVPVSAERELEMNMPGWIAVGVNDGAVFREKTTQ
jgi:hypothetical protein